MWYNLYTPATVFNFKDTQNMENEDTILVQNEEQITKAIAEIAERTAHVREDIINNHEPRVKVNRKDFVNTVTAAQLGVLNNKFADKEQVKEERGHVRREYKTVVKYILRTGGFPSDNSPNALEEMVLDLATAIKWMKYITGTDVVDKMLDRYGLKVEITQENKHNTFINRSPGNEKVRENIINSVYDSSGTFTKIKELEDMIKVDAYEELVSEVGDGINAAQFDRIVTIKAMKNIDDEKAAKKAAATADSAMNAINTNRIVFNTVEPDYANA